MLKVTVVGPRDREIEDALRGAAMHVVSIEVASLSALASDSSSGPDAVVLDLRGGGGIPAAVTPLKRRHPETGVVIVAPTLDPTLLLEAMRAGVNEFVTEPVSAEELERAIGRVVERRPAAEPGKIFGFLGAKGGVGTTTIAVNVATALGSVSRPGRSLMVDLHPACGDAAVFLGVEPRFSIADALENTHRLDPTFFHGLVTQVAPGLDLLPSPDRTVGAEIDSANVRAMLDFVRTAYRYTVVDLTRSATGVLDALDGLSTIVIVANQELATVRSAGRIAATLRQRYGRDRILLVVARSDWEADIGQADVERAVGSKVAHTFPSDYRLALQALNRGRPIVLENHNDLSGSLRRFALQLAGAAPEKPAGRPAGLLGLFGTPRRA